MEHAENLFPNWDSLSVITPKDGHGALLRRCMVQPLIQVESRVPPKHFFQFSAVGGDVTCMIGGLNKDDVRKQ